MASGDQIPGGNSVARGIHPKDFDKNQILPSAFSLKRRDKGKLSTDWVECVHASRRNRNVKGSLGRLVHLTVRPQEVSLLQAKYIRKINRGQRYLDAIEDPHLPHLPCHSAIVGMAYDSLDVELQQDLADLANRSEQATLE